VHRQISLIESVAASELRECNHCTHQRQLITSHHVGDLTWSWFCFLTVLVLGGSPSDGGDDAIFGGCSTGWISGGSGVFGGALTRWVGGG
jgi:hypothetical protein